MSKIFVYCPKKSPTAYDLVKAIPATRLRRFDGIDFWDKGKRFVLPEGSVLINWGGVIPELDEVRALNFTEKPETDHTKTSKLVIGGLLTPKTCLPDGVHSVKDYKNAGYWPRKFGHTGGLDLLNGCEAPDYYTYHERFIREYRVHQFANSNIKIGEKILRDGFSASSGTSKWVPNSGFAHPWIRCYEGGWKISYDMTIGAPLSANLKAIAKKALKVLGLTFAAVDVVMRGDEVLLVLGVDTTPVIEGELLTAYVKAINKWVERTSTIPDEEVEEP